MEDATTTFEPKVVEQASVTSESLCPDAARTRTNVVVGERREITDACS